MKIGISKGFLEFLLFIYLFLFKFSSLNIKLSIVVGFWFEKDFIVLIVYCEMKIIFFINI